jgi:uncharacterized membrane protein
MPYALCPMPYALCPVVPHLSEKGYTSKLSKAVWSIYAIVLSLGLYSSLLFFLVAFAHGIYVIRTENYWRFRKILIAYLLASVAAKIILAAGILV